jgi:hypothetical protein
MRPALLLVLALSVQSPGRYESADAKCRVTFPDKPTETKKPIRPESSALVHIVQYEDGDGGRLLLWNEITAKGADPAKILAGAAEGLSKRGKPVSDKETTVGPDKVPARDVTVDTPEGPRVRTLLVVANSRLYQVTVTGSNEFVAGPKADEFRKSFELVK